MDNTDKQDSIRDIRPISTSGSGNTIATNTRKMMDVRIIEIEGKSYHSLYTGKKDKNGVPIFEGDFLDNDSWRGVVEWSDEESGFILRLLPEVSKGFILDMGVPRETRMDRCSGVEYATILGNRWENPNLFTQK